MKTVIVSGVPGTGKTTLSKKLSKKLDYYYFDVNNFIVKNKLYEGYDKERGTRIIDISILNKKLINEIKNIEKNKKYRGIIIDSHLSHYLPKKSADFCIVTKCDIKELNKRLKNKRYNKGKVAENLQAEIFDICLNEASERRHNILVIDTTKGFNIDAIIHKIGG
ncbi:adenylate kinase family protein [Candidatus Woesearchaeota archaeon]|nr:adenylate kinase family protein [Candidatus Woesearchaeota archaeon]